MLQYFKTQSKKGSIYEKINEHKDFVSIHIQQGSDLEKQLKMIQLTIEDLAVLRMLKPFVEQNIDYIVDSFYKNIEHQPSIMNIINENSSVQRLKMTLTKHIVEMFDGNIDGNFVEQRNMIAHVHVRIGLKTRWYMCAFQDLLLSLIKIINEQTATKEEYFIFTNAVTKILNIEQQIVLEAYEAESERLKQESENRKLMVRKDLSKTAEELAAITEEVNASIQEITCQSTKIVEYTKKGTDSAYETQTLSINSKERLQLEQEQMEKVEVQMKLIEKDIEGLIVNSKNIKGIAEMVSTIAEQTNLLALNAAIEAARAGESGKGFAVVAEEVRMLAEQTKNSVEDVSELTKETNEKIENMSQTILNVKKAVAESVKEVSETNQFFDKIVESMKQIANHSDKTDLEFKSFSKALEEINHTIHQVASSSDYLNGLVRRI